MCHSGNLLMKKIILQKPTEQYGFTLVELMISLVLGLLISAAVIQVFLTSQRVDRVQTAGSEIQDKAVFGLQSIEPQIRLANLGNDGVAINDTTAMGGIILTTSKDSKDSVNLFTKNNELKSGFLTRSDDMRSEGSKEKRWNGTLTNTNVSSDQLTIQYKNTTGHVIYDCEGEKIEVNERVITRYFITEDDNETKKLRKNLNLNCDAGRINSNDKLIGFKDKGQTIIENIDQFNIRLGVQRSLVVGGVLNYQYADMTVKEYMDINGEKPAITNIRLAILARSTANSPDASANEFDIFGVPQTLKAQTDAPKYLRRVYESNILLRNARVMRVIDNGTK